MAEQAARIGERVKALREERGMSQRELADLVPGRSTNQDVSRWERGLHRPSDDTLQHIAEALGTTLPALLVGTRKKGETPNPLAGTTERLSALERGLGEVLERLTGMEGDRREHIELIEGMLGQQTAILRRIEDLVATLPTDEVTRRLLQALEGEPPPPAETPPADAVADRAR